MCYFRVIVIFLHGSLPELLQYTPFGINFYNSLVKLRSCLTLPCVLSVLGEVCSINFEPPDNDLCSTCHVYPLSRGAWIISIPFILNRFPGGGVELHNLMNISNRSAFRVKIFQLLLSMKSQLNVNSSGLKRFDCKRKIFNRYINVSS